MYNKGYRPFHQSVAIPKATDWWNDLPISLISGSETKFSRELYNYLLYI